jgi:hypothetical protein
MRFSEGYELIVPADGDYEAWDISSHNGLKLVCMPGGGIAVWLPRESS